MTDEELFDDSADVDDFLQGGCPPAGFDEVGQEWSGRVIFVEKVQQTDFDTGVPVTWDDGTPKYMLHVDIQTDVRDPEVPGDDGVRRLYVRGNLLTKLRQALRASKLRLRPGVGITATFTETGTPPRKGMNAPKLYEVQLTPAETGVGADDLV